LSVMAGVEPALLPDPDSPGRQPAASSPALTPPLLEPVRGTGAADHEVRRRTPPAGDGSSCAANGGRSNAGRWGSPARSSFPSIVKEPALASWWAHHAVVSLHVPTASRDTTFP